MTTLWKSFCSSEELATDETPIDTEKIRVNQWLIIELVDSIPVDWQPEIFEANTPFITYLCILDCIAGARQRLHYFDRYLKEDFFQLYLRNLDRLISIRLVTTSGDNNYGVRHVTCISNLARQEFTDYQLIQVDPRDLHDRNLRIDSQIFTLGPGTDQAGMKLTNFGPADSSPEAHHSLDDLINNGWVIHHS